jgi:hypothetical protein
MELWFYLQIIHENLPVQLIIEAKFLLLYLQETAITRVLSLLVYLQGKVFSPLVAVVMERQVTHHSQFQVQDCSL